MSQRWLLRLSGGPRTLYAADRVAEPVDGLGRALRHPGGLGDVVVERGVALDQDAAIQEGECSFSLFIEPDFRTLLDAGWQITTFIGELSLWTEGTSYGTRRPVWRGRLELDDLPQPGQAATCRLQPADLGDGLTFPPETARVVDGLTFGLGGEVVAASALNQHYPFPFGAPGVYLDNNGAARRSSATPALLVQTATGFERAVIAGGRVAATTVRVRSVPDDADDTFSVIEETDGLGRVVSSVSLAGKTGSWTLDDTAELYVTRWGSLPSWSLGDGPLDGGLYGYGPTERLARAGSVIRWLLDQQRDPRDPLPLLDVAAWESALRRLNRVQVASHLRDPVLPFEWIQEELLPLLTDVWLVPGPGGWVPVVLDERPTSACGQVLVGRDLYRFPEGAITRPVVARGVSAARVVYGLRVEDDRQQAAVAQDALSLYGLAARLRGAGEVSDVDSAALYSRTDAWSIGADKVAAGWRAPSTLVLWGALGSDLRYPLGSRWRVTDARLKLTDQVAWVVAHRHEGQSTQIQFGWR